MRENPRRLNSTADCSRRIPMYGCRGKMMHYRRPRSDGFAIGSRPGPGSTAPTPRSRCEHNWLLEFIPLLRRPTRWPFRFLLWHFHPMGNDWPSGDTTRLPSGILSTANCCSDCNAAHNGFTRSIGHPKEPRSWWEAGRPGNMVNWPWCQRDRSCPAIVWHLRRCRAWCSVQYRRQTRGGRIGRSRNASVGIAVR